MVETQSTAIWAKACKHLGDTLSKDVFDRWIAVIEPVSLANDVMTLGVANDFYQSWLEENYVPLIRDAVQSVVGHEMQIVLAVDPSKKAAATATTDEARRVRMEAPSAPARARMQPTLNPKYTFDSFVVGPSNSFCPRRVARRGAVARPRLQPAVHLRRRRPRQDAPHAGHRPLRAGQDPHERLLHVLRGLHQRVHRRPAEEVRSCSSARSTATSTCC